MTSTAQNMSWTVKREMANLRSSGLLARVLVDVGRHRIAEQEAMVGMVTPGDHRVEHRQQLLEAQEVPRRLRRVRRLVGVGQLQQRGVDEDREDEQEGRDAQGGHELDQQQVGPDVDLVHAGWPSRPGWSPALTTVSRRWVWPPGPVGRGGGRGGGHGGAATAGGGRCRPRRHRRPRARGRLRALEELGRGCRCRRRPRRPRRRRPSPPPRAASALAAGLFGPLAEVFGDLDHGRSVAPTGAR